jgi:hypothetical protein
VQGRTCKDQAKPALKINGNEEQAMNNIGIVQETALKAVRIATEPALQRNGYCNGTGIEMNFVLRQTIAIGEDGS